MTTGASCIFPKPIQSQDIAYRGKDKEAWVSEMEEGFTVCKYQLYSATLTSNLGEVETSEVNLAVVMGVDPNGERFLVSFSFNVYRCNGVIVITH